MSEEANMLEQQMDLLAGVPLRMDVARSVGETAANLCEAKAVRVADFDSDGAGKFVLGWLARHGAMSGEAVTDAAKEHGYRPHDDRAFGPVFARLSRRGEIRCAGFCERAKGHGTDGGRLWEVTR